MRAVVQQQHNVGGRGGKTLHGSVRSGSGGGGGSNSNSSSGSSGSGSSSGSSGRGNRGGGNRPPPGAINLERSYQICQAVIQNSPNRHQLKAQLRPPPSSLVQQQQQQVGTQAVGAAVGSVTQPTANANAVVAAAGGQRKDVDGVAAKVNVSMVWFSNNTFDILP